MKSKKKSQNKTRSARNKAAKPVQAVETTSIETVTQSSEVELLSKEIEVPIPSIDIDILSEKDKTTSREDLSPTLEHESLSIEQSSNGKDSFTNEKVALGEEEDSTDKLQEVSEKPAEMPSKKLLVPDKEVEVVKSSTIPAKISSSIKEAPQVIEAIKHPLEHNWGFWLNTNENKKNWTENQKELTVFNTVEDYWCLYHHMKLPSELLVGQDYAIFKQGIKPMWEDSANKVGGKWFINLERKGHEVDRIWLDVVLLMIGQNFDNSDIICGAVVNLKQNNKHRVSIWTRNKEESPNMEIGRKLKEILRLNLRLQFIDHKTNNALYVV